MGFQVDILLKQTPTGCFQADRMLISAAWVISTESYEVAEEPLGSYLNRAISPTQEYWLVIESSSNAWMNRSINHSRLHNRLDSRRDTNVKNAVNPEIR